jgi:hypothetical protein
VTERHKFLLGRLAGHHRFVTARQVALLLCVPEAQVARELERLRLGGWLGRFITWEAPPAGEFTLAGPLAVRERGGPMPDLREVARRAAARRLRPTRRVWSYHATRRAVNLVGGVMPDLTKPFQAPHDVACVDMFLAVRSARPHLAESWFGEDYIRRALPGPGGVPDAVAIDADGSLRAFEYAGDSYDLGRLLSLDRECLELGIFAWEAF